MARAEEKNKHCACKRAEFACRQAKGATRATPGEFSRGIFDVSGGVLRKLVPLNLHGPGVLREPEMLPVMGTGGKRQCPNEIARPVESVGSAWI